MVDFFFIHFFSIRSISIPFFSTTKIKIFRRLLRIELGATADEFMKMKTEESKPSKHLLLVAAQVLDARQKMTKTKNKKAISKAYPQ